MASDNPKAPGRWRELAPGAVDRLADAASAVPATLLPTWPPPGGRIWVVTHFGPGAANGRFAECGTRAELDDAIDEVDRRRGTAVYFAARPGDLPRLRLTMEPESPPAV